MSETTLLRKLRAAEGERDALRDKARALYSAAQDIAYASGGAVAEHAQPFPKHIERLSDALTWLQEVLWKEESILPLLAPQETLGSITCIQERVGTPEA